MRVSDVPPNQLGGGIQERTVERASRKRKSRGRRRRRRGGGGETKKDRSSSHPPKIKSSFPPVFFLLLSCSASRVPSGNKTFFLDIHPQKCNDRHSSTTYSFMDGPRTSPYRADSMILGLENSAEISRNRDDPPQFLDFPSTAFHPITNVAVSTCPWKNVEHSVNLSADINKIRGSG